MQLISVRRGIWRVLTIRKLLGRKRHSIVLAAMPKSGSTFLSRTLQQITGFPDHYLAQTYKNIEQELHVPSLIDGYARDTVTQQHFKANEPNIELMGKFGIRPTIVYRNIPDVLVSMRDHLNNEALDNMPNLYPPSNFRDLSDADQLEFLVQHAAPWLVAFFVSWERYRESRREQSLCLQYENCRKDWAEALQKILEFYGVPIREELVRDKLQAIANNGGDKFRKNVGVEGRGKSAFDESQLQRIRQLAAPYRDVDFSPVGL